MLREFAGPDELPEPIPWPTALIDFSMLPNDEKLTKASMECFLKDVASSTHKYSEMVESMKGKIRARCLEDL